MTATKVAWPPLGPSSRPATRPGRTTGHGVRPVHRHYRHTHRYTPISRPPAQMVGVGDRKWARCVCGDHRSSGDGPVVDRESWWMWLWRTVILIHAWIVTRTVPDRPSPVDGVRVGWRAVQTCRRTVLLGVDAAGGWRSRPNERAFTNRDGDSVELIRSRRGGRPGWVDVERGRWFPTVQGASGLNRFWVGGSATWDATAGSKWASTSGGAGGQSVPDIGDNVFLDAASAAVTVTTTAAVSVCRSIDCTGFTGTLSLAGSGAALDIGDASGGAVKFVAGMTLTLGSGAGIRLKSTSTNGGSGWSITTGGKTMPSIDFGSGPSLGGKWVLQDALTIGTTTPTVTVTAGQFFGNGQSITCGAFSSNNANTRTIDITNCTVNVTGTGTPWNIGGTVPTFVSTGSTIVVSGAGVSFNSSALAYGTVRFTGSGTQALGIVGPCSFVNLERTGTATKTDGWSVLISGSGVCTITGTLTLGGNTTQGVNRLLVFSSVVGTQRTFTLTGAAVVINGDVDFTDIALSGFSSWTNTGSAYIGDGGGNGPNIVSNRTTPATQTHTTSAGGSWSDVTKWTSRVPLPQDNVIVDVNTTGTLTADMPRLGADITFTGLLGLLTASGTPALYGSLTWGSGMSFSGGNVLTLAGRGTHTFTSNGKTAFFPLTFQGPGGTYTLQDAFSTTGALTVNDGTFTTNNQSMTCSTFNAASGRATTLNLGTSTVTLTSAATISVIQFQNALLTLNASTATFVVSSASTFTRTVALQGSQTLGTLTYTVANSPGTLSFNLGSSLCSVTTLNVGSGRGLTIFSARTLNVTNWNVNGAANGYLYLPGATGHDVSTPDSVALSITGDIELQGCIAPDSWTAGTSPIILAKDNGGSNREWQFRWNTTSKKLEWLWWDSGGTVRQLVSSVGLSTADGTLVWLRLTFAVATGTAKFYTAPDGVTWTQLGTDQVFGATSIRDQAADVSMGRSLSGTAWAGKYYRAKVLNGIGGTVQLDADFTTHNVGTSNWLDAAKTQFAEGSANAATVTINGTLAQVGDGRVAITASTPGSAATISNPGPTYVSSRLVSIQDSTATGGAIFDAFQSANVSGNTGWVFVDFEASSSDTGSGVGAESIGLTDTDTGSGSEGVFDLAATFTDTDTGSGSDLEVSIVPPTDTDTGAGVDAESSALSDTETAAGADVETIEVQVPADTGTGADSESSVGVADVETGTDTETESLVLSDSDTATDAETESVAIVLTDIGTSVDAEDTAVVVVDADTGSDAETESTAAAVSDVESGTGVDQEGTVVFSDTDTGQGVDAESTAVVVTDDESGTGVETEGPVVFADLDTGMVVDDGLVVATFDDADSGSGSDTEGIGITDEDTAEGDETWRLAELESKVMFDIDVEANRFRVDVV